MMTQSPPPPEFLDKMKRLLPDEYAAFAAAYDLPPHVGLRVNTLKIAPDAFRELSLFALTPVGAHEPAGFLVAGAGKPGRHPHHAAGLYYLQEPSAMVVGGLVAPQPGELVLDLAAAPGGKATHLAARMQDRGLLVANDIDAGRSRILAQNLERWGVRNALITNSTPEQLAQTFGPVFDRVLVDAPCSGEGMFRRVGAFEWGEEMVLACARRQTAVIDTAAQLVRPGGRLVYATCTFSPEENEQVIADFLHHHPDFAPVPTAVVDGAEPARPFWTTPAQQANFDAEVLRHAVRLWPHKFVGEGHFMAVMQRAADGEFVAPTSWKWQPPHRSELKPWCEFARAVLCEDFAEERLLLVNGRLYLLPERTLDVAGVKLVRYGLLMGEIRRGIFKPAHTLALALRADEAAAAAHWPAAAPDISRYLAGHELRSAGANGWVLVTADGFALGWGKRVNGRLKNHYPRGLRR